MRVVYIHQYFRTPEMGGGTRSYEFARRLVQRGHTVDVITSRTSTTVPESQPKWTVGHELGVRIHWAEIPYGNKLSYKQRLRSFGQFARIASARAAALPQDIVLASSTPLTVAIPGVYSSFRARVPMVLEVRDVWPEVPIALGALKSPLSKSAATRLEAWAYKHASHIVALSPDMAQSIKRRFPDSRTTVIPNASDVDLFAGAEAAGRKLRSVTPWLGDRPLVLYAGTLGLVNGVGYLVDLAAKMRELSPDTRIAVVGEGREEGAIRTLAAQKGVLNTNFFLIGSLSKTEVVSYFGACDISCSTVIDVPELSANSANKVFDSWASGRPVAVNHGGWIADIIRETGAGLVLPPRRPDEAATLINDFLRDGYRVAAARSAAHSLAHVRFSRDELFDRMERVLYAACNSPQAVV